MSCYNNSYEGFDITKDWDGEQDGSNDKFGTKLDAGDKAKLIN